MSEDSNNTPLLVALVVLALDSSRTAKLEEDTVYVKNSMSGLRNDVNMLGRRVVALRPARN